MNLSLKQKIIDRIIDVEGGYTNNPADSGGPTRYGVTEAVARDYGYAGDMRDLPKSLAFNILSDKYWYEVKGDSLYELSEIIAEEVVDTGVNCGVRIAQTFLQRTLNVFNTQGTRYSDIVEDGHIGPATLEALGAYLQQRDELVLLRALNCLQGARYIELAELAEKNETFVYGWLKLRVINDRMK